MGPAQTPPANRLAAAFDRTDRPHAAGPVPVIRLKGLAPSFELPPLGTWQEELIGERDRCRPMCLDRRDTEGRGRLPVRLSGWGIDDRAGPEERLKLL